MGSGCMWCFAWFQKPGSSEMAEPEGSLNIPTGFQEGAKEEQVRHRHSFQNNNSIHFLFSVYRSDFEASLIPSFFSASQWLSGGTGSPGVWTSCIQSGSGESRWKVYNEIHLSFCFFLEKQFSVSMVIFFWQGSDASTTSRLCGSWPSCSQKAERTNGGRRAQAANQHIINGYAFFHSWSLVRILDVLCVFQCCLMHGGISPHAGVG